MLKILRKRTILLLLILTISISACRTLPKKPTLEKVTWHEKGESLCLTQEEAKKLMKNIAKERAYQRELELLLIMEGYK